MQKIICDRCGQEINPADKATVRIEHTKFTKLNSRPVELCVPCTKELENFLKFRKEGARIL